MENQAIKKELPGRKVLVTEDNTKEPSVTQFESYAQRSIALSVHNRVNAYLSMYLIEEDKPTVEGFLKYAQVEVEMDNESFAKDKRDTEFDLVMDLHKGVI